jgi:hypothetical protein
MQRAMIIDRVAPTRADLALDLMWRFLGLAEPVFNRVDDSNGSVGDVFRTACEDIGLIAVRAESEPVVLAERVFAALIANDYGVYDGLMFGMLPALGEVGAAHLKIRLADVLAERSKTKKWDGQAEAARRGLQDIADRQEDVDGYIALVPAAQRSNPHAGAAIGRRLLTAGRASEALAALEIARPKQHHIRRSDEDAYLVGYGADNAWEEAYIDALDAAGQAEEAQRLRYAAFEDRLSVAHLRAYLKRLPDFEDIEAEDRAMQHVLEVRNFSSALNFFYEWPDQAHAAQLVIARSAEIDGNLYFLLDPVAQLIEGKYPLAATLLRRAMVDDTLDGAKSTRYKHAARNLLECRALAAGIRNFEGTENHEGFVGRLRVKHGRKEGFWSYASGG